MMDHDSLLLSNSSSGRYNVNNLHFLGKGASYTVDRAQFANPHGRQNCLSVNPGYFRMLGTLDITH